MQARMSLFLVLVLGTGGCIRTHRLQTATDGTRAQAIRLGPSEMEQLNEIADGRRGRIETASGEQFKGKDIQVTEDEVTWTGGGGQRFSLPISDVRRIVVRKSRAGTGLLLGTLAGGLLAGALANSSVDKQIENCGEDFGCQIGIGFGGGFAVMGSTGLGALLGGLLGASAGASSEERFVLQGAAP